MLTREKGGTEGGPTEVFKYGRYLREQSFGNCHIRKGFQALICQRWGNSYHGIAPGRMLVPPIKDLQVVD